MVAAVAVETFMSRRIKGLLNAGSVLLLLIIGCVPVAQARTYGVVAAGLGGNADYDVAFSEAAQNLASGLRTLDNDQSLVNLLDNAVTRESILTAIASQAERMQADMDNDESGASEPVFILMLTGHGNADSRGWRFNVAGPDLSSEDLIAALNAIPTSRQLVVLAASASGAALDSMSQLGRVLVTATKSGGEINAVMFPGYLAQALEGDIADYDRNEILTVAEAFRFADARTREYYEQQNLLASEHSRIRGELADEIAVSLLGSLQDARNDPAVAALLDERLVLEHQFKALRMRKPDMPVEEYYAELETLLLSIAQMQQSIDAATGWNDSDADS